MPSRWPFVVIPGTKPRMPITTKITPNTITNFDVLLMTKMLLIMAFRDSRDKYTKQLSRSQKKAEEILRSEAEFRPHQSSYFCLASGPGLPDRFRPSANQYISFIP